MKQAKYLLSLLRSAFGPALAVTIIAFFGGYALFGSNGVLAWGDYTRKYEVREAELAKAEKYRAELANRVALLDPQKANPDMVDELVRKNLGLAQSDEVIVPLN
jgi:cell division protein FtsB